VKALFAPSSSSLFALVSAPRDGLVIHLTVLHDGIVPRRVIIVTLFRRRQVVPRRRRALAHKRPEELLDPVEPRLKRTRVS
ncbi:hypothetical protein FIBSPDRAFT_867268, partial [Athelia psychrophila]